MPNNSNTEAPASPAARLTTDPKAYVWDYINDNHGPVEVERMLRFLTSIHLDNNIIATEYHHTVTQLFDLFRLVREMKRCVQTGKFHTELPIYAEIG